MSFVSLLIHTATIQSKSLETTGYEKTEEWTDLAAAVPCRKNDAPSAQISDTEIRVNSNDVLFFFLPAVNIIRGNRILCDGELYDVINVSKLYGKSTLHHLEVIARLVDHK